MNLKGLKIAMLAPVCWRTPPRHYGPWEQVASNIAEGLISRGLDVTLFATKDSLTKGKLQYICEDPYEENKDLDAKVCECLHIGHMMEQADKFDLIHNNYDFHPLIFSRLIKPPMVTTIHGFSSPKIIPIFKQYNDVANYVSISDADRSDQLKYIATVYTGINVNDFIFQKDPGGYLLYFGRIHHDKGCYESIQVAKKFGMKLIIAGIIQDEKYFKEKVEPYLNDEDVIFVGHAGPEKRNELLGGAYALLHTINFEEPFGLSVAEAMLCGTPVVAFNKGAMPELIQDKKTGFLVETADEAAAVLSDIPEIKRKYCRDWSADRFSVEKMIDGYLDVYQKVLA